MIIIITIVTFSYTGKRKVPLLIYILIISLKTIDKLLIQWYDIGINLIVKTIIIMN